MSTALLGPMSPTALARWRAALAASGASLPAEEPDAAREVLEVVVDGVAVGGMVLDRTQEGGRVRVAVRLLQTTLTPEAVEAWGAVVGVLEEHARRRGADLVSTAVAPPLVGVLQSHGFRATMAALAKRLDPDADPELQADRRVAVRPMSEEERRRFAAEVQEILRSGMVRAGVVAGPEASLAELEARLACLRDEPPPEELLMTATLDGVPVGRAWATLTDGEDGLSFLGNTIDLDPQYRGQGLTKSFLGALVRHVRELGVREVHLRVYGHDHGARRTFTEEGAGIAEVHLRKDLGPV